MDIKDSIIALDDLILITGAGGFVGSKLVEILLGFGFTNIRAFIRSSSRTERLYYLRDSFRDASLQIMEGNLLAKEDCRKAAENVSLVFHCAAGMGHKTYAESFLNTVVTTRNLLEAVIADQNLRRFVNISSFAVYSNMNIKRGGLLDENSEIETNHKCRYEPYVYAKIKQEELVWEYNERFKLPIVIVRPAVVYGPGAGEAIPSRVGIDTFGIFFHLGGSNRIPLMYVDNCAEAIALAGLKKNMDGQIFNAVDDDTPTSREFLKAYKKRVKNFRSIYIPYHVFYFFSFLWEKYSSWSKGQLPPVYNRRKSSAYWKGNVYTNRKIKEWLGWKQRTPTEEAMERHFDHLRKGKQDA